MPNQMRRSGINGTPRAGKAGTRVKKSGAPPELFHHRMQGIMAHGMPMRMESVREAKDREIG